VSVLATGIALAVSALASAEPAPKLKSPVKVFILAGQSNMEGLGGLNTFDALGAHSTQGGLLKKIRNDDGSFIVRDDVFVFYKRGNETIKSPLTVGMGAGKDRIGPELGFGLGMGDFYEEPVLLIKTCWGGKDLYCDFRPPSAGKPAYEIPGKPREFGAFYRKMLEEVHLCLDHLDTDFPQFKGMPVELSGFVWFQGWNDMCADRKIKPQVLDEYASNFVHLVQDLRAELKMPNLPVVIGEVGVDGENVRPGSDMAALRAGQAKIADRPELKGTLRYVRTAPFWYPELDELPRKLSADENRVRKPIEARIKEELKDKPEASDKKKVEQLVNAAVNKALKEDEAYQKVKAEHDRHISHWICHYQGSARVYVLAGNAFAEAMKELVKKP
jgi:alpha-galactosidase